MSEKTAEEITPVASKTPESPFAAPPGYVLVEESMYQLLMDNFKKPNVVTAVGYSDSDLLNENKAAPKYIFRCLRQHILGNVNVNLNPGDIIEYLEGRCFRVHGKTFNELSSFLNSLRAQFGPKASVKNNPLFEWANAGPSLTDPYILFGGKVQKTRTENLPSNEDEEDSEFFDDLADSNVDLSPKKVSRKEPLPQYNTYPKVKPLSPLAQRIHSMTGDEIEKPQSSGTGTKPEDLNSVDTFPVNRVGATGRRQSIPVPGKPADAAKEKGV